MALVSDTGVGSFEICCFVALLPADKMKTFDGTLSTIYEGVNPFEVEDEPLRQKPFFHPYEFPLHRAPHTGTSVVVGGPSLQSAGSTVGGSPVSRLHSRPDSLHDTRLPSSQGAADGQPQSVGSEEEIAAAGGPEGDGGETAEDGQVVPAAPAVQVIRNPYEAMVTAEAYADVICDQNRQRLALQSANEQLTAQLALKEAQLVEERQEKEALQAREEHRLQEREAERARRLAGGVSPGESADDTMSHSAVPAASAPVTTQSASTRGDARSAEDGHGTVNEEVLSQRGEPASSAACASTPGSTVGGGSEIHALKGLSTTMH